MSDQSSHHDFEAAGQPTRSFVQAIRQQQILHFALAIGASVFGVVTLVINNGNLNGQPSIVSFLFAGLAAMHFVAHAIVPKVWSSQLLKTISKHELKEMTSEDREMTVLTAVNKPRFVGTAILEGAAFMNLIAYMIEQWIGSLAIAAAVIVLMILRTPSVDGTQNKVNDRIREIEMS